MFLINMLFLLVIVRSIYVLEQIAVALPLFAIHALSKSSTYYTLLCSGIE